MTKEEKIDLIANFASLWLKRVPELRFMQLICTFQVWLGQDTFYLPDEQLIEKFEEFLNYLTKKG